MKHTKANGECNTWDVAVYQYNSGVKVVVHAHPTRVALCHSEKYEGLYPRLNEAMANAKLIAAAPELLETLQRALNDFKNQTWTEETYTVINNAINKATL